MAVITIQQAIAIAREYHHAGRLPEAESIYRQVLDRQPDHPDALHLLGVIAHQLGQNEIAVELIGRVVATHRATAECHNNLGNALKALGQLDRAATAFRTAIQLNPGFPEAYYNLGSVLQILGEIPAATIAYQDALQCTPDYAEAHNGLGNIYLDQGQWNQAIAEYQTVIRLRPNSAEALCNLGTALQRRGQIDQSIAAYRTALQLKPDFAEAHNSLGNALRMKRMIEEAVIAFRTVVRLVPESAKAHNNLGNALMEQGALDEAITVLRAAQRLDPDLPEVQVSLGNALRIQGNLEEAIAAYRKALELKPDFAEAHNNLGNALKDEGNVVSAVESYRRAVALNPHQASFRSNLIYTLSFDPGADAQSIEREQFLWNQQHAIPLRQEIPPHQNVRSDDRRLKIGYLSPDFCNHVVGFNLRPLFRCHDREQFEIYCYSAVTHPNAVTEQFQRWADQWRDVGPLSDAQLANRIREDGIDILVDLSLHMNGNRLLVFARKPAPIQVSFAGYPGTTGLETMDYRLTDPYLEPVTAEIASSQEQPMTLPDTFWCYEPLSRLPEVNPVPALTAGFITLGCLNNFCKVNDRVISLWARLLGEIGNSRLVILTNPGVHRARTLAVMQGQGIEAERIEFVSPVPHPQYLALHHRLDMVVDTFPYNGHTTSLDALWMGVPVISLAGNTAVSRAGLSQLSNLGLRELVAQSEDEYIAIAAQLADDFPRLMELRATLRGRMEASPLMDSVRFTRNIEDSYRRMWRLWCAGKQTQVARKQ